MRHGCPPWNKAPPPLELKVFQLALYTLPLLLPSTNCAPYTVLNSTMSTRKRKQDEEEELQALPSDESEEEEE